MRRKDPTEMTQVNVGKQQPKAYQALMQLNNTILESAAESGLDPRLIELVKIRASQLNGCAFCLKMHTNDAIQHGETADRLAVVAAWWESQYFTDQERAALQIAEEVTLLSDHGRLPSRGVAAEGTLTDKQVAAVTWITIVINSWNRVAVFSHYPVAP
ncbi:carboxymuconolactone decarboxylase family protein [Curtobacterium sp. PhB136]|uniref:carboxymuconolactone decarboxylase family protein n=1 Tax=Curtobacterium sp. PhB136 TaxID=2485181 RepID=UPI001FB69851|nr:carboxymuconolactone decarboxylase family protein [Curtobacterium sp. PhB136]